MTTPTLEQALARIAELEHALMTVEAVRPAAAPAPPKDPMVAMKEAAMAEMEKREAMYQRKIVDAMITALHKAKNADPEWPPEHML